MITLTVFLLARIAEDEDVARAIIDEPVRYEWADDAWAETLDLGTGEGASIKAAEFGELFNPARVLAECEAKRRIVERISDVVWVGSRAPRDVVLELLALPYADHPDYDESWRP